MRFQNILIVALAVALANANIIEDVADGVADFISDVDGVSGALNIPSYLKIPTAIKKYSLYANPEDGDDIAAAENEEYDEEDVIDDREIAEEDAPVALNIPYASIRKNNILDDTDDIAADDEVADEGIVYADEVGDEYDEEDDLPAAERYNVIVSAADDNGEYEEGEYDEEDVIDDREVAEIDNDNDPNSMNIPFASIRKNNILDDTDDIAADDEVADEDIVYADEVGDEYDEEDDLPAAERYNVIVSAADDNGEYEEGEYDEEDVIDDRGVAEIDNDSNPNSNNNDPNALRVPAEYIQKYASKYADVEEIDEDVVNADDNDVAYADEVGDDVEIVDDDLPASIKAAFLRKYNEDRAEEDELPDVERNNIIVYADDENGEYEEGEYDEEDVIDDKGVAEIDNDNVPVANIPAAYIKKINTYTEQFDEDADAAEGEDGEVLDIPPPLKIVGDYINGDEDVANAEENDEEYVTLKIPKSYLKGNLAAFVETDDAEVDADADVDADVDADADADAAEAPVEYVKQFTSKEAESADAEEVKEIIKEVEEAPISQKIAAALKAPSAFINKKLEDEARAEVEEDDDIDNDDIIPEAPVKIAAALKAPSAFIDENEVTAEDVVAAENEIDDTMDIPKEEKNNNEIYATAAVGTLGVAAAAAGIFFLVKKSKKRDIKDIEEVIRMEQMNNIRDYEEALKMEQTNIKIDN